MEQAYLLHFHSRYNPSPTTPDLRTKLAKRLAQQAKGQGGASRRCPLCKGRGPWVA